MHMPERRPIHWTGAWIASVVARTSKLTAPDLERLPRTPCPIASLTSSGIRALSSFFARSWSKKASRVLRNSAANSAQEFDELISTMRIASMRGRGGSLRRFTGLDAAPELLLRGDEDAEVKWVHGNRDLDPLS